MSSTRFLRIPRSRPPRRSGRKEGRSGRVHGPASSPKSDGGLEGRSPLSSTPSLRDPGLFQEDFRRGCVGTGSPFCLGGGAAGRWCVPGTLVNQEASLSDPVSSQSGFRTPVDDGPTSLKTPSGPPTEGS